MKMIKFFAAALAIVAAASCTKDNNSENEPKLVHKVFSASMDQVVSPMSSDGAKSVSAPSTKTTLVEEDGKKLVHWTTGDQIKLIPSGTGENTDLSIVDDSIDGTFASFTGDVIDADLYHAVYPSNAFKSIFNDTDSKEDIFTFTARMTYKQFAVPGNFSKPCDISACPNTNIAVSAYSVDNKLSFKNINAYLKFRLDRNDVYSIIISSDKVTYNRNGELSDRGDLGSNIRYVTSTGHTYLEEDYTITFCGQESANLMSGVDYYIAIPAVEIEGLTLKVYNSKDDLLFTNSTDALTFNLK